MNFRVSSSLRLDVDGVARDVEGDSLLSPPAAHGRGSAYSFVFEPRGVSRVARRAGTSIAAAATPPSNATEAAMATQSVTAIPKRR
jgi:hypothetical protein